MTVGTSFFIATGKTEKDITNAISSVDNTNPIDLKIFELLLKDEVNNVYESFNGAISGKHTSLSTHGFVEEIKAFNHASILKFSLSLELTDFINSHLNEITTTHVELYSPEGKHTIHISKIISKLQAKYTKEFKNNFEACTNELNSKISKCNSIKELSNMKICDLNTFKSTRISYLKYVSFLIVALLLRSNSNAAPCIYGINTKDIDPNTESLLAEL